MVGDNLGEEEVILLPASSSEKGVLAETAAAGAAEENRNSNSNNSKKSSNSKKNDNVSEDSSDDDDDDDLEAMMRFVGDKQGLREMKGDQRHIVREDEYTKATKAVTQQHREEQDQAKKKEKRKALHALTLKNLRAADPSGWEAATEDDELEAGTEDEELIQLKMANENASEEKKFSAYIEAGKEKIQAKDFEAAKAILKQGLDFCEEHPGKISWQASMRFSMGSVLLQLGDVRLAIVEFIEALKRVRSCPPSSRQLEKPILQRLVQAYSDIGKMSDAEACQKEVERLSGQSQGPAGISGTSKSQGAGGDEEDDLPSAVAESMDQAIEGAVAGHFGFLRALLNAFREGRGEVSLQQIVNFQHSVTLASPLMVAAAKGEHNLVQALLHAGANVHATSADGSSALAWACKFNQPQVLRTLLESGAQFDASITSAMIESLADPVKQAIADFVASRKQAAAGSGISAAGAPVQHQEKKTQKPSQTGSSGKQNNKNTSSTTSTKSGSQKRSGKVGGPRKLEKWAAGTSEDGAGQKAGASSKSGPLGNEVTQEWDQFKANEALGVHANSFDENLYTTKLDIDSIPAEVQAQADALCEAMQRDKATNPRAQKNPDDDEEALYSAVSREPQAGQTDEDGFTDAAVLKRKNRPRRSQARGKGPSKSGSKSK